MLDFSSAQWKDYYHKFKEPRWQLRWWSPVESSQGLVVVLLWFSQLINLTAIRQTRTFSTNEQDLGTHVRLALPRKPRPTRWMKDKRMKRAMSSSSLHNSRNCAVIYRRGVDQPTCFKCKTRRHLPLQGCLHYRSKRLAQQVDQIKSLMAFTCVRGPVSCLPNHPICRAVVIVSWSKEGTKALTRMKPRNK